VTTPSSHASSSSFTTNRQLQLSNEFSTCTQQRRWPLRCLLARSEGILARLGILAGAKEFDRHIYADGFVSFSNSDLVYSGLSSPQAAQCIFPCCAFFRRFLKIIFHVFFLFFCIRIRFCFFGHAKIYTKTFSSLFFAYEMQIRIGCTFPLERILRRSNQIYSYVI